VVPGNHDIPLFNLVARLLYPYANHQRVFGRTLEPVFASPDLLVIGVNTTRPSRHIGGEVSAAQIQRVVQRLRRATHEQLRIVVTHQPVHVPRLEEEKDVLHGHRDAIPEWANAGVDLLMGGHIHLPYVRPLNERFNDLPHPGWVVQAGTAVSTRVRYDAPNSLNLIRYSATDRPQRCVVERWDHRAAVRRFEPVACTEIPLDRVSAGREGDPRNAGKKP
jgi:hypothetical protein